MSISKIKVGSTDHQLIGSPRYATCSTAASTAAKVASLADSSATFTLETGVRISVKFTNANSAASPTLNVASSGAKAIYWHGAALASGQYWQANAVLDFLYNGTQWELVGVAKDNNTTYSVATTSANGLMSSSDKTKLNGIATGANAYSHPTSSGNKHIPAGGSSGQILRWSADGTATWGSDNNTTYSNFVKSGSGAKAGLVPAPSTTAGTTKYLREDGTWAVPPDNNTTYSNFVKSGSSAKAGLVPAPSTTAGTTKYLREDGTWAVPPDNNTVYTHPTSSGNKHIPSGGSSGQILRWSADGTAAWGADNNTTYSAGTGISLSGTTFSNSGVRSIATGGSNGTISVNTNGTSTNVAVKGLGSAAYTASTAYATAAQGTLASNALPKSGGTMTGNITMDNSSSAQSGEPYIQWATVSSNKPYTGFAHDQSDGTFIICSMEKDTTTNGVKYYRNGLAIGGGSGNLFWKGNKVIDASNISEYANKYTLPAATSSALGGVKVGSNITNSSGTISLTKANVTAALGYTPPTTNTTYGVVSTSADGLAPKRDGSTTKFLRGDGTWAVPPDTNTDTKNTAGSTNSSSKLFLIGATSQATNPQTYSHDTAYVGTDGCLYSNSKKVSVEGHTHSGYAPAYTYGTEDLQAGVSALTTGQLYFVYE